MKKYLKIYILITAFVFVIPSISAFAATTYTPLEPNAFPGVDTSGASGNLGAFLGQIFNWAIALAVALAVIMIIWGGIQYMTTDSWSGKEEGKTRWTNALLGLGLALVSWLLLYTINPCLVYFSGGGGCGASNTLINPTTTKTSDTADNTANGVSVGNSNELCGDNCIDASSIGLNCKNGCFLNEELANNLKQAFDSAKLSARVTEGYPPTVDHSSACHSEGTCADVNLSNQSTDVNDVINLYQSMVNSGLNPVYEINENDSKHSCDDYPPEIECITTTNATAPHFHVEM